MDSSELAKKNCIPCKEGTSPMNETEIAQYLKLLTQGWEVKENHHLEKAFTFKNFKKALEFTVAVGAIAEEEGHHPDIFLSWGKVKITLWTHKINGLSESDFVLAAKIDTLRM